MTTVEETETAMRALNGSPLDGRTLTVERAVGRGAGGRSGGNRRRARA
jgi:RNA recognition motif-containing protein